MNVPRSAFVVITGAVTTGAGSLTVIVNVPDALPAAFDAVTVMLNVPAFDAFPESRPPSLIVRSSGRFSAFHVIGAVPVAANCTETLSPTVNVPKSCVVVITGAITVGAGSVITIL